MGTITIRKIPDLELQHLLNEQVSNKMAKNRDQYSLEKTLLKIIREHKMYKEMKITIQIP